MNITEKMLLDLFLMNLSNNSKKTYINTIQNFKTFLKTNYDFDNLINVSHTHVLEYNNYLLSYKKASGKPLAPSTCSQRINMLSSLFIFGCQLGYFSNNPVKNVKRPKLAPLTNSKYLNPSQIHIVFDSLKNSSNHTKIQKRNMLIGLILLYTGIRISELCSINWRDFRKINDTIILTINSDDGNWRNIKIRTELWQEILGYRLSLGLSIELCLNDDSPLLYNRYNKRLTQWGIRKLFNDISLKNNLGFTLTPNWFRQTSAIISIENGANIIKVMNQFGWKNISTVNKYSNKPMDNISDEPTDYINYTINDINS